MLKSARNGSPDFGSDLLHCCSANREGGPRYKVGRTASHPAVETFEKGY